MVAPLEGIRVLELSQAPAAGFCGKWLARWGADVLALRSTESAFGTVSPAVSHESMLRFIDAGKRVSSLPDDGERSSGVLAELLRNADVVISDQSPDAVRETLRMLGKTGMLISITPFGLDGPYAQDLSTPATLLALGGYSFIMGDPGAPPLTFPGLYPYYQAGLIAYTAVVSTLLQGTSTDTKFIEVSVFDSLISLHQHTTVQWTYSKRIRSRSGNRAAGNPLNSILPCGDGWLGLCIVANFWDSFVRMLNRPELSNDPRFVDQPSRTANGDALTEILIDEFASRSRLELMDTAQHGFRVPIGTVATLPEVLSDPQLIARGFWQSVDDEAGRVTKMSGAPFRFVGEAPPRETPARRVQAADTLVRWQSERASQADSRPVGRAHENSAVGPLSGFRVLDLTRVWAGPLAARFLGDLGADVIKIEAPTGRSTGGTTAIAGAGDRPWNQQGSFNKLNRNKRSLVVDLKTTEGRALFLGLVRESDVVLENFSHGAMEALGLGHAELQRTNPAIVYVAMPGFGASGPYHDYVAYGPSIEPMTGMTSMMGYREGSPRVSTKAIPDAIAGTHGAAAVVTALLRRARGGGTGQAIDLSQFEASVEMLGEYFVEFQQTGESPPVVGNGHRYVAPHGTYRCRGADEWIALAARDEQEWKALCALAGRGWGADPRFADAPLRVRNAAVLDQLIESWTCDWDKHELMRTLQAVGVPAGAVLCAPEMLADPHLRARGFFASLHQPDVGIIDYPGAPIRAIGLDATRWRPAPTFGQHTKEVLREVLGLSEEEIAGLRNRRVVATTWKDVVEGGPLR